MENFGTGRSLLRIFTAGRRNVRRLRELGTACVLKRCASEMRVSAPSAGVGVVGSGLVILLTYVASQFISVSFNTICFSSSVLAVLSSVVCIAISCIVAKEMLVILGFGDEPGRRAAYESPVLLGVV